MRQGVQSVELRRAALGTVIGLPGNAAAYDLTGTSSDSTFIKDGSNRISLVADRSGNSAVNSLILNGAVGNYASTPDSAAISVTGDIDLRWYGALEDWTPAAENFLISKAAGAGARSFFLEILNTTGKPNLAWTADGTTYIQKAATVAPTVSDGALLWIRATLDVDNGAAGNDVIFYTSTDGSNWTQLGTTVTTAGTTSVFDSTTQVEIGSLTSGSLPVTGKIYRAQIYNGIAGTLVLDANFTLPAKLVASFTESSSNAATVTINTTGDLGARISGARDLVQLTAANQPIYSVGADGKAIATFDGTNDYLKAAPFSLSQPESVYFVGSQVTWTNGEWVMDGNTDVSMFLQQDGTTPRVAFNAGSAITNVDWAVGVCAVIAIVVNGANSSLGVNRNAPTTGNVGAANAGGFTVAKAGASGGSNANITFSEALLRSVADDAATRARIVNYEMRKWGIT